MIITETCKEIREKIGKKSAIVLLCHGIAGCGKSQIVLKMAEDFPFPENDTQKNNDLIIKWHIQCKDSGHDLQAQLKCLAKRLLQGSYINQETYQNVVENLDIQEARELVNILVKTQVPVVIIVEDPPLEDREKLLKNLCRSLKDHDDKALEKKFHVYISSRKCTSLLHAQDICYNAIEVKGFNHKEAVKYLSNLKGRVSQTDQKAINHIVKLFGGLPLGLQAAKGYCTEARLSYTNYIDLVEVAEDDIINKEGMETIKEYKELAPHLLHAIVTPFIPKDETDTMAVLHWKILCCISHLNYDQIPRFVLEQCCHILRKAKVKKPQIKNRADVGFLISRLIELNMCTETDIEDEITFHEVVLNAFRLSKHTVLIGKFQPLEKTVEIMCTLSSKDMRKVEHSANMRNVRSHLQSLLRYIEKNPLIFERSEKRLLFKALSSHLHEITAAIMLNESPSFRNEADQHFKKSLNEIWPEMNNYIHSELQKCPQSDTDIAKEVLQHSMSKASTLPKNFIANYTSKLHFSFDNKELQFLQNRSASESCFDEIKNLLNEKDSTESLVKKLHDCKLFLDDYKHQQIFYAERFASILHSWSRVALYGNSDEAKEAGEKHIRMSNLSHSVCKECKERCGVPLLIEHLSKIGGRIPLVLKLKGSAEELEKALATCKEAMHHDHDTVDMFENGMLKEVYGPSYDYTRINLLRYIVQINARLHKEARPQAVAEADASCEELFKLCKKHSKTIGKSVMCLIYCAKYYAAKKDFEKAMECYQKYFELEPECKQKFNIRCWAIYNFARSVSEQQNCLAQLRKQAVTKCKEALQSKDVITKSLKSDLDCCLKAFE